jgi:hypothetical protein
MGSGANTTKRLFSRYAFRDFKLSAVKYESAGMGITDLDCELKFTIGQDRISIDVVKNEAETVLLYYRCLTAMENQQRRNAHLYEMAKDSFKKIEFKLDGAIPISEASMALTESIFQRTEAIESRYNPTSYGDVFEAFIR